MNTLILLLFGLSLMVTLVVVLVFSLRAVAQRREQGPPPPRTSAERETDRRSAMVWGLALVLVIGGLALAWFFTQGA